MTLLIDTKPTLEWVRHPECEDQHYAKTIFGIYWYNPDPEFSEYSIEIAYLYDENLDAAADDCDDLGTFSSESEAKAAAQADYERRTAERFRPITLPDRMNARQGDGSVHYCTGWNDVLAAIDKARGES